MARRTLFASTDGTSVVRVDVTSGKVLGRVTGFCCGTEGLAVDERTATLYFAGTDASIYALDEKTLALKTLGDVEPMSLAVDDRTDTVYATDQFRLRTFALDGRTGRHRAVLPLVSNLLVSDPPRHRVYAPQDGHIAVINAITNRLTAPITVPVSRFGQSLAVDERAGLLYALAAPGLVVIDLERQRVLRTVPLPSGQQFGGVAVDSSSGRVYVSDTYRTGDQSPMRKVLVLNRSSDRISTTVDVGTFPGPPVVDPTTHRVYVPCRYGIFVLAG